MTGAGGRLRVRERGARQDLPARDGMNGHSGHRRKAFFATAPGERRRRQDPRPAPERRAGRSAAAWESQWRRIEHAPEGEKNPRRGLAGLCATSLKGWWSQAGSNRRPRECHSRALPTELWPRSLMARTWGSATARLPMRRVFEMQASGEGGTFSEDGRSRRWPVRRWKVVAAGLAARRPTLQEGRLPGRQGARAPGALRSPLPPHRRPGGRRRRLRPPLPRGTRRSRPRLLLVLALAVGVGQDDLVGFHDLVGVRVGVGLGILQGDDLDVLGLLLVLDLGDRDRRDGLRLLVLLRGRAGARGEDEDRAAVRAGDRIALQVEVLRPAGGAKSLRAEFRFGHGGRIASERSGMARSLVIGRVECQTTIPPLRRGPIRHLIPGRAFGCLSGAVASGFPAGPGGPCGW